MIDHSNRVDDRTDSTKPVVMPANARLVRRCAMIKSLESRRLLSTSLLTVLGNHLVNAIGPTIRLTGVNIPSLEWNSARRGKWTAYRAIRESAGILLCTKNPVCSAKSPTTLVGEVLFGQSHLLERLCIGLIG